MAKPRPFAVFDIDGTLIRWQMFHALFECLDENGLLEDLARKKVADARDTWRARAGGEESYMVYEESLVKTLLEVLPTIDTKDYEKGIQTAFERHRDRAHRYTRQLIHDLKKQGYLLFTISGSTRESIELLAGYYGFDDFAASEFLQENGRFTGKAISMRSQLKVEALDKLVKKHGATYEGSVGIGDSEGDIQLLEAVENPIAFNPSKKLFLHAKKHGWKVVIERKNVIYELEPENDSYRLARINEE